MASFANFGAQKIGLKNVFDLHLKIPYFWTKKTKLPEHQLLVSKTNPGLFQNQSESIYSVPPGSGTAPISAKRFILFFSGGLKDFGRGLLLRIPVHSNKRWENSRLDPRLVFNSTEQNLQKAFLPTQ